MGSSLAATGEILGISRNKVIRINLVSFGRAYGGNRSAQVTFDWLSWSSVTSVSNWAGENAFTTPIYSSNHLWLWRHAQRGPCVYEEANFFNSCDCSEPGACVNLVLLQFTRCLCALERQINCILHNALEWSALYTIMRSLLRFSSTHEPNDPPLRVFTLSQSKLVFVYKFLGRFLALAFSAPPIFCHISLLI